MSFATSVRCQGTYNFMSPHLLLNGSSPGKEYWPCTRCTNVYTSTRERALHMSERHGHLYPCGVCALQRCILPDCTFWLRGSKGPHCHDHGHEERCSHMSSDYLSISYPSGGKYLPNSQNMEDICATNRLQDPPVWLSSSSLGASQNRQAIQQTGPDTPAPFSSQSSRENILTSYVAQPPSTAPSCRLSMSVTWSTSDHLRFLRLLSSSTSTYTSRPGQAPSAVEKMLAEVIHTDLVPDPAAGLSDLSDSANIASSFTHPAYIGLQTHVLPADVDWSLTRTAIIMELGAIDKADLDMLLGSTSRFDIDLDLRGEDTGFGYEALMSCFGMRP